MMKIAFLTDQHLSFSIENPFGIDTKSKFTDLLNLIRKKKYDAIVLGGDLCYMDGDLTTYHWIREALLQTGIPHYIISGNHDDPGLISEVFFEGKHLHDGELYYSIKKGEKTLHFLDTTKGFMDNKQYEWLSGQLANNPSKEIWLFMHHPPVISGSKHMDSKYAFQQTGRFQDFCAQFSDKTFHVFSGHCHLERTIVCQNCIVYITPSSYINIDPDYEAFTPLATQKNGYRELIWDQGSFYTNVFYMD